MHKGINRPDAETSPTRNDYMSTNEKMQHTNQRCSSFPKNKENPTNAKENYDERMDCSASCCWGCNDDQVDSRADGGKVCRRCLNRLIIRLAVCSVANSVPAHKTYTNNYTISDRERENKNDMGIKNRLYLCKNCDYFGKILIVWPQKFPIWPGNNALVSICMQIDSNIP